MKLLEGQITDDWRNYLLGKRYAAGADFPVNMYYKQIMEAFPDNQGCKDSVSVSSYSLEDQQFQKKATPGPADSSRRYWTKEKTPTSC